LVAEELRDAGLKPGLIVLEPCPRNTAPAIVTAALIAVEREESPLLLILPSDHAISPNSEFLNSIQQAVPAASAGYFVCFGVKPTSPETGFGYVTGDKSINEAPGCKLVDRFVEKPDLETAKSYLADGSYFWNAGLFLFPTKQLLEVMDKLEPELLANCREALSSAHKDLDFLRLDELSFSQAKNISIDNALMERTERAAIAPVTFDWSDLGSYSALRDASPKDDAGNTAIGDVITRDTKDSFLYSEEQLVAAINVENLTIVATQDVVLVAPNSNDVDLKALVKDLKDAGRVEADTHATVYRPWGNYRTTMTGPGFLVKEIIVKPGQRLSSQYHNHRAEHWVVVEGTANIEKDGEAIALEKDQSIYIPLNAVHRLENKGTTPLHLIEVQTGNYLAEDDIVRLEDDYRRSSED
jgi:mannose-1-phosphate guanylyltransferase/mannose-6-phosphate isomerase